MKRDIDITLVEAIEKHAYPLDGVMSEYDPIIDAAKDKQFVLIGEASHGTKEFYRARAEITQRLIEELDFDAVAVEADWPDAYTVNRYVTGSYDFVTVDEALKDFERFPTWLWRNTEVKRFVEWLYAYNHEYHISASGRTNTVGFYGLDLYSMYTSVDAVIAYLEKVDPDAAQRARTRYSCLDHFISNPKAYGSNVELNLIESCEQAIIEQLVEMRKKSSKYMRHDGHIAEDEYFSAERNAKLILDADEYYRSMLKGRPESWNVRDKHMFETMESLAKHLGRRLSRKAKIVVWAHNSHVGNAGATEMSKSGEINIGQLTRYHYKDSSLLIGFSTSRGTVTASSDWDSYVMRKKINNPFPGSYEDVFHHVNHKKFMLDLTDNNEAVDLLMESRLQRAIGVIYRPDTERHSHYYYSCLPEQFDFMLHYDNTSALDPLQTEVRWHHGEMDETYPTGL